MNRFSTFTPKRSLIVRAALYGGTALLAFIFVLVIDTRRPVTRVVAAVPDVDALHDLAESGQGDAALAVVVATAATVGGWSAAPGDAVVFAPYMARDTRGAVLDYDDLPDCADPRVAVDEQSCISAFKMLEQQVRFGPSLFSTPQDGGAQVRPAFDDVLSTYIEEVGHSWQEYQYETEGRGEGARTRRTSKAEAVRWSTGREYQIKRYILSLDGSLIHLSGQQRSILVAQICGGYADPLGHEVPPYGPPAGWPYPEGWPTAAPTPDALNAFCAGY
ncbi:hypothetical protein [Aggregatilinea lenta]|uniref:hypothetical protein n=1 Tax=Aggregatilinea lenta TaxID=913108 RepID=UPI000E5C09DB|nr:hypothetical protein [Aggregatilinea lenta]